MSRRDDRLVPIAEFSDPVRADRAWVELEEAGIPAGVVTDPSVFGSPSVTRVYVAEVHVAAAQRVVAKVMRDQDPGRA
jgi:hypothetical protein